MERIHGPIAVWRRWKRPPRAVSRSPWRQLHAAGSTLVRRSEPTSHSLVAPWASLTAAGPAVHIQNSWTSGRPWFGVLVLGASHRQEMSILGPETPPGAGSQSVECGWKKSASFCLGWRWNSQRAWLHLLDVPKHTVHPHISAV